MLSLKNIAIYKHLAFQSYAVSLTQDMESTPEFSKAVQYKSMCKNQAASAINQNYLDN